MIPFQLTALLLVMQAFVPLIIGNSRTLGATVWALVATATAVIFLLPRTSRTFNSSLIRSITAFSLGATFVAVQFAAINLAGPELVAGDVIEVLRPLFYVLMTLFGAGWFLRYGAESFARANLWLATGFVAVYAVLSFTARDAVDGIESYFGKIDNVVSSRLFVPFVNPYDLGVYLLFPLACAAIMRGAASLPFLVLLAGLLLTQSRTALFTLVFLLIFAVLAGVFRRLHIHSLVKAGALGAFIVGGAIHLLRSSTELLSTSYLIGGILRLWAGEDYSFATRLGQYDKVGQIMVEPTRLWFGYGSFKELPFWVENDYLLWFLRCGVFAAVPIVTFHVVPAISAWVALRRDKFRTAISAYALFVLAVLPACLGNSMIGQAKFSLFYFFGFGVVLAFICHARDVHVEVPVPPRPQPSPIV